MHVFDDIHGYNIIYVTNDDQVYGMGTNVSGQLGLGHATSKKRVHTWGRNGKGQLASCGNYHALALTGKGSVYGWGFNGDGEVGCGVTVGPVTKPQKLQFEHHQVQFIIKSVYCSEYCSFAITMDGLILGWGHNHMGQLARPPVNLQQAPNTIRFFDGKNVSQLSCGYAHAMALTEEGSVYGWGCNTSGQIGCGYTCAHIAEPTLLQFRHNGREYDVKSIYCSGNSVFVITEDNRVFSWGLNDYFNLGHNSTDIYVNSPQLVVDIFERLPNYGNVELIKHVFSWQNKIGGLVASINANSDLPGLSKEAEKLVKVRSEFVVQYNDFWVESDRMFIQMELCSRSLQSILDSKPEVFGREPEEPINAMEYYMSCHIFCELLECLQYLHGISPPVIHRDLKPANILLAIDSSRGRFFKVGDFGLATINEHYSEKGNPKYLAPEVNNESLYTYKIDIYSLSRICELDIFELDINALDKYV
ncbi:unnamed protein product [Oppiella nova]|uniref:Protein kinase domain-containing protein n=1 Tax=Oppiella nova TaxID=334625 RepID=A0A7R9QIN8_9ACAR|nr:unnamed protein product [Oppiella nova]CAG2166620.1 unnamed protein product [Oppiella nova]